MRREIGRGGGDRVGTGVGGRCGVWREEWRGQCFGRMGDVEKSVGDARRQGRGWCGSVRTEGSSRSNKKDPGNLEEPKKISGYGPGGY